MSKKIDLTNQRFRRLVALEPTKKRRWGKIVWKCICDCGNEFFIDTHSLISGNTQSCGCLARELKSKRLAKQLTKHGMSKTSIYNIWVHMIQRCENPNNKKYKDYGGRGIKVCERWHSFENFYADVGDPPEGLTLDRWPDNDGNYEPTNWRWATPSQQRFNSRPASCGPFKQHWFSAYNENADKWFEDNSQNAFAKKHNLSQPYISACLHGRQKTHKGWTFKWLPDQNIPRNQPEVPK